MKEGRLISRDDFFETRSDLPRCCSGIGAQNLAFLRNVGAAEEEEDVEDAFV